jgi:hypothetical protein
VGLPSREIQLNWLSSKPGIEHIWIKIGSIGPDNGPQVGINADLPEITQIPKRRKHTVEVQIRREV